MDAKSSRPIDSLAHHESERKTTSHAEPQVFVTLNGSQRTVADVLSHPQPLPCGQELDEAIGIIHASDTDTVHKPALCIAQLPVSCQQPFNTATWNTQSGVPTFVSNDHLLPDQPSISSPHPFSMTNTAVSDTHNVTTTERTSNQSFEVANHAPLTFDASADTEMQLLDPSNPVHCRPSALAHGDLRAKVCSRKRSLAFDSNSTLAHTVDDDSLEEQRFTVNSCDDDDVTNRAEASPETAPVATFSPLRATVVADDGVPPTGPLSIVVDSPPAVTRPSLPAAFMDLPASGVPMVASTPDSVSVTTGHAAHAALLTTSHLAPESSAHTSSALLRTMSTSIDEQAAQMITTFKATFADLQHLISEANAAESVVGDVVQQRTRSELTLANVQAALVDCQSQLHDFRRQCASYSALLRNLAAASASNEALQRQLEAAHAREAEFYGRSSVDDASQTDVAPAPELPTRSLADCASQTVASARCITVNRAVQTDEVPVTPVPLPTIHNQMSGVALYLAIRSPDPSDPVTRWMDEVANSLQAGCMFQAFQRVAQRP